MTVFDCLIVGAGPAGGSAAYHLAKGGRCVLVLEKEALPRYKPCGGGVAPVVQQWFDFDFSPAISLKLRVNRYTWNGGDPVEVDLETSQPIWMVRRDIFDHFLIQQAQKQGATLRDRSPVTGVEHRGDRFLVQTPQETFTTRYLIAADGGKGRVGQMLGFPKPKRILAGALEAEIPIPNQPERRIFFEFGMVKHGYLWNFPKADGYSLGIGAFSGRGSQKLRQILNDYGNLFDLDLAETPICPHPISLWHGNQKLHTDNAVLAGEAACVVDPFSAEGIRPSMFSGVKAARAIDAALGGDNNALEDYSRVMAEEWGSEMSWARRLAEVFYRFPSLGYRVGVKRPSASRTIGKIFCGEARYSDVARSGIDRLLQQAIGRV